MTLRGHVKNGVIILDDAVQLPDGMEVRVEALPTRDPAMKPKRVGGQWKGKVWIADDFEELPDDLREAFGMNDDADLPDGSPSK
jgi:hypothetical protein